MQADLLIENARQVVTSRGGANPLIKDDLGRIEIIENGAVAVGGGRILAVGTTAEVRAKVTVTPATRRMDAAGQIALPGLVDAHTHLVFAGSRENELDLKLKGVPYLEILAQGGGILSTVRATRAADREELVGIGRKYARQMLAQGTTTAEVKSGYGLTVADELKQLEAVRDLASQSALDLVPTFMGAHAFPPEYKNDPEKFVDLLVTEMIPAVARQGLAEYCDVFCEKGVFSVEQSRRILQAGLAAGLKPKIHAEEIECLGGAELASELGAASADHLLMISDAGIRKMADAGVVAVLLPATTFYLREDHYAPARKMIEAGVPVALASDFNPGSCPNNNLQFVMTVACLYLRMTPAEVINAVTINAAHAVGRADRVGSLEEGKQADIVLFDAPSYQYLPYRLGSNLVTTVIKQGKVVVEN
ncbi:MAG TPA: imidazolonepropionase [Selenomonadales bacterium]|nr:imidazolonepropionase [Selenomonadales bacterium]